MDFIQTNTVGMAVGRCGSDIEAHDNNMDNRFVLVSRALVETDMDPQTYTSSQTDLYMDSAQGFKTELKPYMGWWNITSDTVTLLRAEAVTLGIVQNSTYNFSKAQKHATEGVTYAMEDVYVQMLPEFDWKYPRRRTADAPASYYSTSPVSRISTDATFVATMIWSRMTTKLGPTSPEYDVVNGADEPLRYTIPISVQVYTQTLKQHWALAVILIIFPVLTFLAIVVRATACFMAPISNDFGLVSVLAAAEKGSLYLLHGAGYSGQLSTPIAARFSTSTHEGDKKVKITLQKEAENDWPRLKTHRRVKYH